MKFHFFLCTRIWKRKLWRGLKESVCVLITVCAHERLKSLTRSKTLIHVWECILTKPFSFSELTVAVTIHFTANWMYFAKNHHKCVHWRLNSLDVGGSTFLLFWKCRGVYEKAEKTSQGNKEGSDYGWVSFSLSLYVVSRNQIYLFVCLGFLPYTQSLPHYHGDPKLFNRSRALAEMQSQISRKREQTGTLKFQPYSLGTADWCFFVCKWKIWPRVCFDLITHKEILNCKKRH